MATADVVTIASGTTGALFRNGRCVVGTNTFGAIAARDCGINDVSTSGQIETRLTNRFDDPDYYGGLNDSVVTEVSDNLELWLKADFLTAFADGDLVHLWPDASDNGRDAENGTSSQQPTFVLNSVDMKGKPVVRFATDDSLDTAIVTAIGQPSTIFAVYRGVDFAQTQYVYDGNNNATHRQRLGITSSQIVMYAGTIQPYATSWPRGVILNTVEYNGSSSKIYDNGALILTADAGSKGWDGLTIGADYTDTGSNFNGDIAEIIVYSEILSDTNRSNVETYLGAKYNIK